MKADKISILLRIQIIAVFAFATITSGGAAVIATENFNSYSAGNLSGNNGGSGWSGAWSAKTGVTVSDTESLTYNLGGNTLGGGNSLKVAADSSDILNRNVFSSTNTSGQNYYMSMIFRPTGGTSGTNISSIFTGWQAKDSTPSATVDNVGLLGSSFRAGARVNNATTTVTGTPGILQYDTTYFVVMEYSGWDGSNYLTTTLWLNPTASDQFTTDTTIKAIQSSTTGSDGFLGLQVRSLNLTASDYYLFDDITVGDSWASVVPEPSTWGLLFAALLTLVILRVRFAPRKS